jgi:hypothetical protein
VHLNKICFLVSLGCLCIVAKPKPLVSGKEPVCLLTDTLTIKRNKLTEKDRHNYKLTATLGNYCSDSCGHASFLLYATLENKSDDTLKYLDWTCDHFIWRTNNKYTFVSQRCDFCDGCAHNLLDFYPVPPHQHVSIVLRAGYAPRGRQNFRLGMIIQRVIKRRDFDYYQAYYYGKDFNKHKLEYQTQNTIWSNEISIY